MPSNTSRIPHSKPLFFGYMADTAAYLLLTSINPLTGLSWPHWQRMNWLATENDEWQADALAAAGFAPKWINKVNRAAIQLDVDKLITRVHTFDHNNHMLDRQAAQSPLLALALDFTTFHIKHDLLVVGGIATSRHGKVPTEKIVYFSLKQGGIGQIHFGSKPTESSKRNHLLAHYDVEWFYEILPQKAPSPGANELVEHELFHKSTGVLNLGALYSGMKLHIAGMYRHKTNPALNGGLSPIQSITIP